VLCFRFTSQCGGLGGACFAEPWACESAQGSLQRCLGVPLSSLLILCSPCSVWVCRSAASPVCGPCRGSAVIGMSSRSPCSGSGVVGMRPICSMRMCAADYLSSLRGPCSGSEVIENWKLDQRFCLRFVTELSWSSEPRWVPPLSSCACDRSRCVGHRGRSEDFGPGAARSPLSLCVLPPEGNLLLCEG